MRILGNPDWRTLFESFKDPPEILVLDDWRPDPVQSAAVLPHLLPILEKHTPKTALLAFMPPKVEKVFKFYAYARWTLTGEIAPFQLRCLKNALAPTQGHILAWP